MTDKKTVEAIPNTLGKLSKHEIDELVKCLPPESYSEALLREECLKQHSLRLIDALRRDFMEAKGDARGRKIVIFVTHDCYRAIFHPRNELHSTLNEVDEHATLWGCDLKVFEDAPTRNPKYRHKRGLDYYIHIQCVGRI
ncbi:hypothetical protein SAMN02745753_03708 [Marinomonas polaris DSM 16579]|uniref:Uncharacterized protein n=1 Tax=Marinomonas polaris DSM 16579 TaxID=1122206 RepID=A0A1M5IXZ3_9GAMM|nr:hypothetical protein [Marinomonas polaris]SHG33238.1 hypothetical protein SAMN02745753_03708 [Marinomonas polaris DSM 16579]